ncbi:MAG: methyltransferase domain-containing protein [Syntrophobacterales bacterium]|jgi:SAM-dependent methyltransferase|nr:methyltransferase domain-containing protein [Syntrophobacterales bacterium]
MTKSRQTRNAFSPATIRALARDGVHEKVIGYLRDKPRGEVLDIPTGLGALAEVLHGMKFHVSCCDIDTAQFLANGLMVDRGDLNGRIPYEDGKFDYVCFLEAIEHTENPYNAVRELARVLKPGGTLILSTPNYLNIERRLKFLVTGFFTRPVSREMFLNDCQGKTYGLHMSPMGYTLIRFALEHAGLDIRTVTYDKKKPKQMFLKPVVWLIRLYIKFWPEKKRAKYWLGETSGSDILEGGNTLIIFAEKPLKGV